MDNIIIASKATRYCSFPSISTHEWVRFEHADSEEAKKAFPDYTIQGFNTAEDASNQCRKFSICNWAALFTAGFAAAIRLTPKGTVRLALGPQGLVIYNSMSEAPQ